MEPSAARIAVVDDEEDIKCLLASELQAAGFEVRAASDGLAGLEMIRSWEPSLILLDVMMPKIDGISILPRFRALTQAPRHSTSTRVKSPSGVVPSMPMPSRRSQAWTTASEPRSQQGVVVHACSR